ncbi:MAG TPA: DUF2167 domain-containing protein [Hymenobacter sp.]|jgi:uncharacterized membrane-anchored protein|uniref:DUF2167 domain-containing protein n=1 Tax=Hymenobacter sp. TaxID=1898978 RepID=UPI002ED86BA4
MKKHYSPLSLLLVSGVALAAPKPKPAPAPLDSVARRAFVFDSINNSLHYQTGRVVLPGGISEVSVPKGFHYLDSAQSRQVLTRYWGNPDGTSLGMLFPEKMSPLDKAAWAYVIEYDPSGHVKDDDADDIDYEDLLDEMRTDMVDANKERTEAGYEPVELVGWASAPYYDKAQHTLHWAKTLKFGDSPENTLNYNVRVLGRKGVLILNAVGSASDLPAIKASIPGLLSAVSFAKGEQYVDFDPGIDEVAAYGIGGLVAGKVLAKVGLFAVLLKFWKLGLLALAGAWAGIKKFFGFGAKEA